MLDFQEQLARHGEALVRGELRCLQVNIGYRCNLTCHHCHVEAGPNRTEIMSWPVMEQVIAFAGRTRIKEVDITGGAPEINPHLLTFIEGLRRIGSVERIMLRTNLAILEEADYQHLPVLFAKQGVELIASMPCYLEENVEAQRGKLVYPRNISVLKKMNRLGYGLPGKSLKLNLVYNPLGNFLPAPQAELEAGYKEYLQDKYGISFDALFTITNMPIGRFRTQLEKQGALDDYMALLAASFNRCNLASVMCRSLLSIDWRGQVFDCDFNQMLGLAACEGATIAQLDPDKLAGQAILTGNHCYACVAGTGSSCQGRLTV